MDEALLRQIRAGFDSATSILLVCHEHPDGDAIGSLLGLGLSLEAAGKRVQMISVDGVPAEYRFLSGAARIRTRADAPFDLSCVLDCSDLLRVGKVFEKQIIPDLNIDHHVTNLHFARLNLVDLKAVATAEILTELIAALDLPMNIGVSDALLTGLVADSLGFRTSNITPKALRQAADLMDVGSDLSVLYRHALIGRSYEAVRYWGRGLQQVEKDGALVWSTLTLADRNLIGYPGRDDADLINVLSSIDDTEVAIIFVEQPNEKVKVSWRAQPGYDVSQLALQFGGGGHPAAAGAEISGALDEVRNQVLEKTRSLFS